MNYQKIYDELCLRGQQPRKHNCYTEKHHIIPRCLNGLNTKENLTVLTAREHFIAHRLLAKIHNTPPLWYALINMTRIQPLGQRIKVSSRSYDYIRKESIKIRRLPEQRQLAAEKSKGNINVRGKKWWYNKESEQYRRSVNSPGDNWILRGRPASDKQKQLARAKKGIALSDNAKINMSIGARKRPSNSKGTIWVVDTDGNRKRVFPNNIPTGYMSVNKQKENNNDKTQN